MCIITTPPLSSDSGACLVSTSYESPPTDYDEDCIAGVDDDHNDDGDGDGRAVVN